MARFKTAGIITGSEDMVIVRRKGRKIRYQNRVTGAYSRWVPDHTRIGREAVSEAPVVPSGLSEAHLSTLTVAGLRRLADHMGVKVPSKARKADIIAALTN